MADASRRRALLIVAILSVQAAPAWAADPLLPPAAVVSAHGKTGPTFSAGDCRTEFSAFGTAETLFNDTLHYMNEKSLTSVIDDEIAKRKDELEGNLAWIGPKTGFLIDIRIGESNPPAADKMLIGASFVGHGSSPEASYALNSLNWSVSNSLPSGYQLSNGDSFMVWFKSSGSRLERFCINGSERDRVLKDASVLAFSQASSAKLREAEQSQRYADLAQLAENRAASAAVRDRLKAVEIDRQRAAAELDAINSKLRTALDDAASAASVAYTINLLRGILSFAQLAATASGQLGDKAPQGLSSAASEGEVMRILDVYKAESDDEVVTIRKQLDISVQKAKESENRARDGLKASGVPMGVMP